MTSTRGNRRARAAERGAILIHVAIMVLVLVAGAAFVLDFGVVWLARGQAQNAADAGAHAGAVALAFDETGWPPSSTGAAHNSAVAAAQANVVFGAVPGVEVSWECPSYVSPSTRCVRVDVYRDGTHGSTTLPAYFAPLLGVTSQGIKATATAQAQIANASCLRPWAVSDKWDPFMPPDDQFDHYASYSGKTGFTLFEPPDVYRPPSGADAGSGYSVPDDFGTRVTLKLGEASDTAQVKSGWFAAVNLPLPDGSFSTGGSAYREQIAAPCSATAPVSIGQLLPTLTGNKVGPTVQGVRDLVAQDPRAHWVPSASGGGGIADSCCVISPRIVAVAVFNPDTFQRSQVAHDWDYCPGGGDCVQISNIFGFFVEGADGSGNVTGIIIKKVGVPVEGGWVVGESSAFLYSIRLVR